MDSIKPRHTVIIPPLGLQIPREGLDLFYESPEVSQEVSLKATSIDPQGIYIESNPPMTLFQIKVDDHLDPFEKIQVSNLNVVINSHPGEGGYVTHSTHVKLKELVSTYTLLSATYVSNGELIPFIELETQAASMSWGGIFDYKHDPKYDILGKSFAWRSPHCTHRDGNSVDFSMSVFENNATFGSDSKKALQESIIVNNLDFPIKFNGPFNETPGDPNADHWHTTFGNK